MNACYAICYDYVFVIKIVTFENTTTVQHADHKMYQKFEIMILFNSKKKNKHQTVEYTHY